MQTDIKTHFLTPFRQGKEEINRLSTKVTTKEEIVELLNLNSEPVMIINQFRQIIYANQVALAFLQVQNLNEILGLRVGESINCAHAKEMPGGCGTAPHCADCEAIAAVLESRKENAPAQKEAKISLQNGDALDVLVTAKPFALIDADLITYVQFRDISAEKRKEIFERILFHDLGNSINNLNAWGEISEDSDDPEINESYHKIVKKIVFLMGDNIKAYRTLKDAEENQILVQKKNINCREIIADLIAEFDHNNLTRNVKICNESTDDLEIVSSQSLLKRVLTNLLKNAIEASPDNASVQIGFTSDENSIEFFVKNEKVIASEYHNQIFKRNFSTKEKGRGLGTYGSFLLTKKYLNGDLRFESEEGKGTIFYAKYPLILKDTSI